jgi:pimeloyl-ACP methyl ester carboxylesterase
VTGNRVVASVVSLIIIVVILGGVLFVLDAGPFAEEAPEKAREASGTEVPREASGTEVPQVRSLPVGSLVLTDDVPGGGANQCDGESCQGIEVACDGVAPARGALWIQPPPSGPTRGVVVLFSGGDGRSWWVGEDSEGAASPASARTLEMINEAGIEVIQVRWDGGWVSAGPGDAAGLAAAACRPATVVEWVHENRWESLGLAAEPGACGFCVAGSSGGASQAAYALSHYGLDTMVDALVLASGPPHAALAKGCSNDPALADYRYVSRNFASIDPAYGADGRNDGPCGQGDPNFAARFERDGVDTGGTDYVYESTRVHVILGSEDPTTAPVHAQDYLAKLRAAGSPTVEVEVVEGMAHGVTGTPRSVDAFVAAITTSA